MLILLLSILTQARQPTQAPKKPLSVSSELYCGACQGIVREVLKRVRNKTNEWEVVDAMEDICNLWNFKVYAYPPPKMREGCDALIRDYEEEIEWAIAHRHELDEDVEDFICSTTIRACKDIQMPKDQDREKNEMIEKKQRREKRLKGDTGEEEEENEEKEEGNENEEVQNEDDSKKEL